MDRYIISARTQIAKQSKFIDIVSHSVLPLICCLIAAEQMEYMKNKIHAIAGALVLSGKGTYRYLQIARYSYLCSIRSLLLSIL